MMEIGIKQYNRDTLFLLNKVQGKTIKLLNSSGIEKAQHVPV